MPEGVVIGGWLFRQAFFIIMIHKRVVFASPECSSEISVFATEKNRIYIEIKDEGVEFPSFIVLNKETAQAFVKYIREEIKLLEDE